MEQQSESFDELESKYFTYVPYHEDDPDITWGFDEKDAHNHSPSCQPKRRPSIQETQDQVELTPLKQVAALSVSNLEINTTSSKKRGRWDPTEASDVEDCREVIKRRRQLVYAKSPVQDSPVQRPSNIYPNTWESIQARPQTQRRSFSSASPSSYQPRNQNRRRGEGFPSTSSYSPFSRPKPFRNSLNSSTESIESPHKKLNLSVNSDRSLDSADVVPSYKDYQLLGDSQLVRFSEQLLGYKQLVTYTEDTQSRRIGYCVSGQKIKDLQRRISNKELPLADKIIMLIGTNDMIYGTDLESMEEDYLSMLNTLKSTTKRIVIVTVPPVPKLAHGGGHMAKLKEFNQFLMNCADDTNVFAVDLASLFISYSDTVSTQYFEEFYGSRRRSNSRVDLIHLNRAGFRMLSTVLDVGYFDKH